ncbi:Ankyrin-1 [Madurella mycetomatis]|uniref:Ankyrin-1 n=1 Tax=Madurella mycetomatis TaxID=100816 RepID=A0A175W1T3_9PEZI|nr:Ankyrin-1 [Madurella mycetomatis]
MASIPGPIFAEASRTRRRLRDLCNHAAAQTESGAIPDGVDADSKYLAECLDRFNIWAGSLGVFQKGDASLDARLSNHILAREVIRLLKQLHTVTSDHRYKQTRLRDIIDGKREQMTWTQSSHASADGLSDTSSWSDDELGDASVLTPETGPEDGDYNGDLNEVITESRDLHLLVNESITSLLRLSVQVHRSSRKAKFAKSSVDENYQTGPDISHVRHFFPRLDAAGNIALAERLGKANAQRRQWLWYRRRHSEKLSVDLSSAAYETMPLAGRLAEHGGGGSGADGDTESITLFSADERPPGSTWSPSLVSGTKASTFKSRVTAPSLLSPSNAPPDTLFGRSSMATASEQRLRHVHSDLSSYTCFAENCDEVFFESRNKWWAHEMEAHRKNWTCGLCNASLPSLVATKRHIQEIHPGQVRADQTNDRGLPEDEIARVPADKFGRHLGRHLEQLALFVLPSTDLIDEDGVPEDERKEGYESGSDDNSHGAGQSETLPDPDLLQKLSEVISLQQHNNPGKLHDSPDLAMRWQPPQDFTPPIEDFDAEGADNLPVRQEPIYGGDLHTPAIAVRDSRVLDEELQQHPELLKDQQFITRQLAFFASRGMEEAMEELLARIVSSCSRDELHILTRARIETDKTLLMVSAAQGLGRIVQQLLDLGADPNVTVGLNQQTALDVAADAGYFSIAQQLVASGADASQAHTFTKILSNEREYAGENTKVSVGKQSPSNPVSKINFGMLKPLGRAAFEGDMTSVSTLLRNQESGPSRCDIEEGAEAGCAPFLLASMRNHLEMMVLLLSHGANINTTSMRGWTPLMLASERGDEDCVKWLSSKATNKGFTRIMALLLDAGADPEIRAQSDWAPLMHAAYRGDIEAVNLLLDAGASFEEISARDETVMLLAAAAGSATVVKRLLAAGCPPDSMWSRAGEPHTSGLLPKSAAPQDYPVTPKLQERIERVYKVGWTPLMVASQVGNLEIVAMLLDAGANLEPKSPMFKTALEIARENGKLEVAEYLERQLQGRSV